MAEGEGMDYRFWDMLELVVVLLLVGVVGWVSGVWVMQHAPVLVRGQEKVVA